MSRIRSVAVALVALLVCSSVAGLAVGAIPDNRVTVTGTTVSPETPTAGAPTTVSATVRLSAGSTSAASLERVAVLDDGEQLGAATDLGTLSPGETLSVPVTVRFDEPGARNLTVVATVVDDDGETTTVSRPLSLVVETGAPQIEIEADALVAGAESPATVTVSNPTTAPLRDLTVAFVGVDGNRTRRTVATLAAGASQDLGFGLRPEAPGDRVVAVEVAYTTATGTRAVETRERTLPVEALEDDVGIRVERTTTGQQPAAGGDGLPGVAGALGGNGVLQSSSDQGEDEQQDGVGVTVTNFGNAPVDRVVLVPRFANGSAVPGLGRVAVSDSLAPGETESVTVDLSSVRASSLRFVVDYELAGESRETVRRYDLERDRGAVALTGLNLSRENDRLRLSGNLGNIGDGEVRGVVVRVGESQYAAPAYPQRNYFLGTVGASEFAPFELTARVDAANATSVPVEVVYTTAGERRTETVEVPLPRERSSEDRGGSLGRLDGTAVVGAVGLLVAVPLAGLALRRYR